MSANLQTQSEFLNQILATIAKNIASEQFGVSELAEQMNMSRSNLLRKVKKETNLSVSQLISQVRLKQAMELLQKSSFNVSEVSHQVGFSSTSYFIKCFREFYGYPPGEVGKRQAANADPGAESDQLPDIVPEVRQSSRRKWWITSLVGGGIMIGVASFYLIFSQPTPSNREISIAVLPFKNDSNDSTNLYLINGLMEATLNNLQQIKELKVISRTSVEKYRNSSKSIPEMAKDLGANYFVEGSGQKIGDKILLNIQLIDASSDKHLWANQYRREAKEIFELQQEIAKNITEEIQVIITPEEEKRIDKKPTDNLEAYDLFLKGRDLFYRGGRKDLENAVPYFKKAIEKDRQFSLAYANAAMVFYYLDFFQANKKYDVEISSYADKAMSLDPRSAESMIAKGLSYMGKKEYSSAIQFFEKALEFNPNSGLVLHFLSELYNIHAPNTAKYLEYALMKVKVDIASTDSATASYNYLQLSNALLQTGFFDEAMKYMNKTLEYNPKNPFGYVKIFIRYAKTKDLEQTKDLLIEELNKDTTRFDVIQQIGTICYAMRDYQQAWRYYQKSVAIREAKHLDLFRHENLNIAYVLAKIGLTEKSEEYLKNFKDYADNDRSIYKQLHLTAYYAYLGDTKQAIEHMKLFSKEDNYQYWVLLFARDPAIDSIKRLPEFKNAMRSIETKFWNKNKVIGVSLKEKGLL